MQGKLGAENQSNEPTTSFLRNTLYGMPGNTCLHQHQIWHQFSLDALPPDVNLEPLRSRKPHWASN
eukprot:8858091-Karenia_brevis.AAC.1